MEEKKSRFPKWWGNFPKCEGFSHPIEDEMEKWPPPTFRAQLSGREKQPATGWIDLCSPSLLGCLFAAPCGAPRALRVQHYGYRAPAASAASRWHGFWQDSSLGQVKSGWISAQKRSHFVEFTRIHPDIWCCLIVSENYCRNEEAFCVDGSPSVTYLFCYTIELQYMSWGFCCHSLNQSCGKKPYLASGIPIFVLDERKENRKLWKSRMTRVKNFGGKVSQKKGIPHETCFLLMLWWKPKCHYFQFRVLWFGLCHPTYLPFISLNMPQPAYLPRFSPLKHPSSSITYPLRLSITLFGMGIPKIMEWI